MIEDIEESVREVIEEGIVWGSSGDVANSIIELGKLFNRLTPSRHERFYRFVGKALVEMAVEMVEMDREHEAYLKARAVEKALNTICGYEV